MTNNNQQRVKRHWQSWTGFVMLLIIVGVLPFLNYYFGHFYRGTLQEYKEWYPRLFFIIYPVVKILPLVVIGLTFYLLRFKILQTLKPVIHVPALFFNTLDVLKKIVRQYLPGVLVLTVSLSVMLAVAEYALRKIGFKPGYRLYSIYFHPVDSLYNIEGFYADSNGIFCVDSSARSYIRNELKTKKSAAEITPYAYNQSPEIFSLPEDFLQLRDSGYHSVFKTFLEDVNTYSDSAEQDFFEAVKQYVACPINLNGFRSIEFKKYKSKKISVLLLGDSFTWGHSTTNKTNSFADLLLAKGYIVYNTGISGADPGQYLQLAKVLVPLLQPDFVVVNFFLGNDIQYFNREPLPYMPVFYSTNAGNLVSCPEGVYFNSPEEAYDYTLSVFTIPVENNRFNRFCAKTAVGTLLWRTLAKAGLADATVPRFMDYTRKMKQAATAKPYSDEKLRQIQEITRQHGGKFLLLVIPELKGNRFIMPQDHKGLFEGLEYHVPKMKKKHYNAYDGHFNDEGSSVYAAFADSLMRYRAD